MNEPIKESSQQNVHSFENENQSIFIYHHPDNTFIERTSFQNTTQHHLDSIKEMLVDQRSEQSLKKRSNSDESTSIITKKVKRALDVSTHWKNLYSIHKTTVTKIFPCQSKHDYLIIPDPLGHRSRFVLSKSSYYWLNESIRLMQQHVEYGSTLSATINGEIIEIERNLKALKSNIEKHGAEKTFFHRAEALVHFLRLCCTIFENPLTQFHRRLHALFKLCAISWLHMFDFMLPMSIVRIERNFVFDDDYGDFENDSILRSFRKEDQEKIRKVNCQIPNLRHLLYSIIVILDQCHENDLIDRIYLERFQMIYEIWMLIDNEINQRENRSISIEKSKRTTTTNPVPSKLTWNFLVECQTYEQIFGAFTNSST